MSVISNLSRRQWLAGSLSLAAAPVFAAAKRTVGVQLYTVRGTLMKDSEHILKTIADIGYKEIEGAGRNDLIALLPLISQFGMKPVSCHVETPLITGDWEKYKGMKQVAVEEAIDSVKKAGVQYFTMAYIQPQRAQAAAAVKDHAFVAGSADLHTRGVTAELEIFNLRRGRRSAHPPEFKPELNSVHLEGHFCLNPLPVAFPDLKLQRGRKRVARLIWMVRQFLGIAQLLKQRGILRVLLYRCPELLHGGIGLVRLYIQSRQRHARRHILRLLREHRPILLDPARRVAGLRQRFRQTQTRHQMIRVRRQVLPPERHRFRLPTLQPRQQQREVMTRRQ